MKVSSHSLPVRVGFVIWDAANTVNICYVFAGKGILTGKEVPEIILLNSHDGSSSYQMIPEFFVLSAQMARVCGNNFGEIRVPHKGDIVGQVIEGAYEVLGVFDKVTENMETMKEIHLNSDEQHLFGRAALMVRYEDENKTPVTPEQIITPRRWEDKQNDLWTTRQRVQENMIKGGLSGRSASGKNTRTRAITGIDGDIRINKALWMIAEQFRSGSHDNISKAPKNFRGFTLYYHPSALLCRLICLNFINWLFGSL